MQAWLGLGRCRPAATSTPSPIRSTAPRLSACSPGGWPPRPPAPGRARTEPRGTAVSARPSLSPLLAPIFSSVAHTKSFARSFGHKQHYTALQASSSILWAVVIIRCRALHPPSRVHPLFLPGKWVASAVRSPDNNQFAKLIHHMSFYCVTNSFIRPSSHEPRTS